MSNIRDKQIEEMADFFKALSNPNRLKMFLELVSCCMPECVPAARDIETKTESEGCACVGDLGKDLDIVPSTISHHLKELRRVGLINIQRKGQKIECRINPEALELLQGYFA